MGSFSCSSRTTSSHWGKGLIPSAATLRGLLRAGSAGCSALGCTGAGAGFSADVDEAASGWAGGAGRAGSSQGSGAASCTGGSSGSGGRSSSVGAALTRGSGCGSGSAMEAGAAISGAVCVTGATGSTAGAAGAAGALTKGCGGAAAAKGRGVSCGAAGRGAASTAARCIIWGGSDRLKRASSSSMRWSLPRVMCSRALPKVRMARMASFWPSCGPFSR